MRDYFDVVVSCEDVSRGKPDPEPFLKAASLLGIDPERCVVIEDGEFGFLERRRPAALSHSCLNTQTRAQLAAADIVVETLEEVNAARIMELLGELESDK